MTYGVSFEVCPGGCDRSEASPDSAAFTLRCSLEALYFSLLASEVDRLKHCRYTAGSMGSSAVWLSVFFFLGCLIATLTDFSAIAKTVDDLSSSVLRPSGH